MKDTILTSFSQDQFNRKPIATNLTNILLAKEDSLVISLDSDWGTGKTTFVQMWKDMLSTEEQYQSQFETIYFNAWENDYTKNPLLALFTEIHSEIHKDENKKQLKKFYNRAKPFLKVGVTSAVKLATAGILNLDKIDLGEFPEHELIELAEKIGDIGIQEVFKERDIRETFKKELLTFSENSGKKIIFFIDELDRCRPNFAIELLEAIKHLFDINNFAFIVSIDKEQLSHSIATIYGQNMDTVGYLRRFFDLDYKLPSPDLHKYTEVKNQDVFKSYDNTFFFSFFLENLITLYNFSLRDIDKLYYYLELLLPQIPNFQPKREMKINPYPHTIVCYLYANLIVLKIKEPIIYKKIMDDNYTVDEILKHIKTINIEDYNTLVGNNGIVWHTKSLQQFINPLLSAYLELNLKTYIPNWDKQLSSTDEYIIKLTDKNKCQDHWCYNQINLIDLLIQYNIKDKLAFINDFKQN